MEAQVRKMVNSLEKNKDSIFLKSEVLMAVAMKSTVFCNVTLHSLIYSDIRGIRFL
jgi:hypothetical protein